ncbi:hypothetical protein PSPO01_07330, partial [Paraphaeosphaeria sporulosa]
IVRQRQRTTANKINHLYLDFEKGNLNAEQSEVKMSPVCLHITSHAHSPPLRQPPDLKYDLRTVLNPPKNVRDRYTGVDKRLREEMQREKRFVELVERAERERERFGSFSKMWWLHRRRRRQQRQKGRLNASQKGRAWAILFADVRAEAGLKLQRQVSDIDKLDPAPVLDEIDEDIEAYTHMVRISAFCAAGRHRSVAFACALASCDWAREWTVRVEHRDLSRKNDNRKDGGKGQGKRSKERMEQERMDR